MIIFKAPPAVEIVSTRASNDQRRPSEYAAAPVFSKDPDFGVVLQADAKRAPGVHFRKRQRRR